MIIQAGVTHNDFKIKNIAKDHLQCLIKPTSLTNETIWL